MTHDEMIAVIQAHKEGKTLQMRRLDCNNSEWVDTQKCVAFNFPEVEYRIKPEPHYRPFGNAEKVMDAIKEHGDWITQVSYKHYDRILLVERDYIKTTDIGLIDFEDAFAEIAFADGTPFGVKED